MKQRSHLDINAMLIASKYFQKRDDYLNLIQTSSLFKELLDYYHFNPISVLDKQLFKNMETQHIYTPKDEFLSGMIKYVVWYEVTYGTSIKENTNNVEYKNICFQESDYKILKSLFQRTLHLLKKYSFNGWTSLKEVVIESPYINIDDEAFSCCNSLQSITFKHCPISIGSQCFNECRKIEKFIVQNCNEVTCMVPYFISLLLSKQGITCSNIEFTETDVGFWLLAHPEDCAQPNGYKSIKKIHFPTGITSLQTQCFFSCDDLIDVIIPSTVKIINGIRCTSLAFSGTDVPLWIEDHQSDTNENDELIRIELPENTTSLGLGCFGECPELEEVILPEGLESIGYFCFCGCAKLSKINIPTTLKSFGPSCFYLCDLLKDKIDVPKHCWVYYS
ncbi:hypothetical protein QTN25_006051 [Entamoeba marina]